MKRFLGILVLGLLLSGNANTESIIKIPTNVYILEINEKEYFTETTEKQVRLQFEKANNIWAKVNIFWDIKKINFVPANTKLYKSKIRWLNKNIDKHDVKTKLKRARIVYDLAHHSKYRNSRTINVFYLPYFFSDHCGQAAIWANDPKPKSEFLLMAHKMNPTIKEKKRLVCTDLELTLAHELGHMLHIHKHEKRNGYLMASGGMKGEKIFIYFFTLIFFH